MKFTRVIAVSAIAAVMGMLGAQAQAQSLREASPPAEFPPASFKGKQYVDSRGCIYIRAGIDGNVTWVPRVTRGRKQVCGYKPTLAPGTATAAAKPKGPAPVMITLPPEDRPDATQPDATRPAAAQAPKPLPQAVAKPAPKAVAEPKPAPQPAAKTAAKPATTETATAAAPKRRTTAYTPSPGPEPTVFSSAPSPQATAAAPMEKPRRVAPAPKRQYRPSPGPEPTVFSSTPRRQTAAKPPAPVIAPRGDKGVRCPNASAFSQQYINKGARCGPQDEAPVTYRGGRDQHSALRPVARGTQVAALSPDTRIVPRHVYDKRRNTNSFEVPKGYRPVWKDDRLNPHRAERTLRPADPRPVTAPPPGYVKAARDDDRLNPNRGSRTAQGDAQTDMIWTQTVPRRLVQKPTDRPVVRLPKGTLRSSAEARRGVIRLSTRSAPGGTVLD